jgi:two-component sensor histidine kinase
MHPRRYPGDRWLIKRQLNDHEFLFIPLKADSIIYYNSAKNKRVASILPSSFYNQLSWESKFDLPQDTVLLLNGGFTGFFRMHFNRQTGRITANEKKLLPNYQVQCLFTDKDGRLWVGTSQGLLKQELTPPHINSFLYPPSDAAINGDFFSAVFRYKKYLYAGQYSRDHGLSVIDVATMKRVKQIQFFGTDLPLNEVMSIEMYHPDTLWIGTWGGIIWYDTKTDHYGKVFDEKKYPWAAEFHGLLTPACDGYAWFSSYLGGKVVRYNIASRTVTLFSPLTIPTLPFEKVKGIVCDAYGDVWIGGHALTRWNTREQRFDTLINVYGGSNKFNDDIVAMSADKYGSLWMHNADNGLLEYKIREKRFVSYSGKDGPLSSEFASFSHVIGDKLWLRNNYQLFCWDIRTKQYTVYDYNDGLPQRSSSSRRMYFDPVDSQVYSCAENYLAKFPSGPKQRTDVSGELRIEDITVNNNIIYYSPNDKLILDHRDNSLALHFTIVDYERGNFQFAYRLNNSSTWNPIGIQRSISFNNLAPGEYLVELSASGKPGVIKTKSILIIIKPPFWATTWFIILSGILTMGLILWMFRLRLKRVRQRANLDKQLSKTEMKALQAQMNPHFIFNSLNSIREMVLSQENKEASHYLSKFAQLIRITLEQSTQETISLRATIDYLNRYIEMETIRNTFLRYEIITDDALDLDDTLVSPMLIQPFVENAIWHGVSATRKDIRVKISFEKNGDLLICTVNDNGMGIQHSQSLKTLKGVRRKSLGIANVQDRIKLLNEKYGLNCSVVIIDKKERPELNESGTMVTIQLPYQTTES